MKKYLFILIAFLGALNTQAQWSFGLQASISESWHMRGKVNTPKEHRLKNINASLLFYKKHSKYFEFGFELGIAQRGSGKSAMIEFDNSSLTPFILTSSIIEIGGNSLVTSYIELPVKSKINIPLKKGLIAAFFKIGAGPSWLASATYEKAVFGAGAGPMETINLTENDDLQRWEFGTYGSFGCSMNFKKGALSFSIDFYQASTDFGPEDVKNRSDSYSLSYSIDL